MDEKTGREFQIPEFEYFDMGGKYSGCKRGMNFDDFSFRITPKDDITIQIWYDIKCFDLSETVTENKFELTRDGYHAACDWIEEQYKVWLQNHRPRPNDIGYFSEEMRIPDWFIDN